MEILYGEQGMCAFPGPPDYVIWEVTLRCNLRCKHCAAAAGKSRPDELDSQEAMEVIEQLGELGVPAVALMGGEVLLRRDWTEIATGLIERGIAVGLITNGTLFNEKVARQVLEMGIVQVGVSLDGPRAVHDQIRGVAGSFDRVMKTIELLTSMDIEYKTVITSVNTMNIEYLDQTLEILLDNAPGFTWMVNMSSSHEFTRLSRSMMLDKAGFLRLARFIGENRAKYKGRLTITATDDLGYFSDVFGELHEQPWKGCQAGISTLGIRSNGDVTGCSILPDQFIEGNVKKRTLKQIWDDPACCSYNRQFQVQDLQGKCKGCKYGEICRAGCMDHALAYTGTIYEYPFCLYDMERRGEIG